MCYLEFLAWTDYSRLKHQTFREKQIISFFGAMHLRAWICFSALAFVKAQQPGDDGFDELAFGIAMAILVDVLLLLACIWHLYTRREDAPVYGKPVVPEGQDPKEFALAELQAAFDAKNAARYAGALELALEVNVDSGKIPCVYSLQKQLETFKIPVLQRGPSVITAQLCFILDYTGSMKEQINQAEKSCRSIVDAVKAMKFNHMPEASVDLEMAAVGYNDWDDKTANLKRPVVFAYGGKEIMKRHDPNISLDEFNLGGKFTKDTDDIMKWIKQPLGNGGSIPEELTGALIAASHLPWSAKERLAVVITDAPCHGKAYSNDSHDPFCDKDTGLTCTGKPEVPLLKLKEQNVQVVILHTGNSGAVKMCQKLLQTSPTLISEKVSPSQTADRLVNAINTKLELSPLSYVLQPFSGSKGLNDLAAGHEVELKMGSEIAKHRVGADGLIWLGKPSASPTVTVSRPGSAGLDEWWEAQTAEQELSRSFDAEQVYMLKMPCKKREQGDESNMV